MNMNMFPSAGSTHSLSELTQRQNLNVGILLKGPSAPPPTTPPRGTPAPRGLSRKYSFDSELSMPIFLTETAPNPVAPNPHPPSGPSSSGRTLQQQRRMQTTPQQSRPTSGQRSKTPVPRLQMDRLSSSGMDRPRTAPVSWHQKDSAFVTSLFTPRTAKDPRASTVTNDSAEIKFSKAWGEVTDLLETARDTSRPPTGNNNSHSANHHTHQHSDQTRSTSNSRPSSSSHRPMSARVRSTPRSASVGSSRALVPGDDAVMQTVRAALQDEQLREDIMRKADQWKKLRKEEYAVAGKKNFVELNLTSPRPGPEDRARKAAQLVGHNSDRMESARQNRQVLEKERNVRSQKILWEAAQPIPGPSNRTALAEKKVKRFSLEWRQQLWLAAVEQFKVSVFFESVLIESKESKSRLEASFVIFRAMRRFKEKLQKQKMDQLMWRLIKYKTLFMAAVWRRRRRIATETIMSFLQHVKSGGKVWFAMRRYRSHVLSCFGVMRRFLTRHRFRMQLMCLQYNAIESEIVHKHAREFAAGIKGPLPLAKKQATSGEMSRQSTSPRSTSPNPAQPTATMASTASSDRPSASMQGLLDSFPATLQGNPLAHIGLPKRYYDFPFTYCIYPPTRTPADTAQLQSPFFLARGCDPDVILSMERYEALYSRPALIIDPAAATNIPKRVGDAAVLVVIHRTAVSIKARLIRRCLASRVHTFVVESMKYEKDLKEYKRMAAAHEILQKSLPKMPEPLKAPQPPPEDIPPPSTPSAAAASSKRPPPIRPPLQSPRPSTTKSPSASSRIATPRSVARRPSSAQLFSPGSTSRPQTPASTTTSLRPPPPSPPPPPAPAPRVLVPPVKPTLRVIMDHEDMKKLVLEGLRETVQLVENAFERADAKWGPKEDKVFVLERFVLDMKKEERVNLHYFTGGIEEGRRLVSTSELWRNKVMRNLKQSNLDMDAFDLQSPDDVGTANAFAS